MTDKPEPKIGAGHAEAMFRLGLRELRAAFYPESNIAQSHAEYGVYGTAMPSEVAEAKQQDVMRAERPSILAETMKEAEARSVHGRDAPEMERG